MSNFSKFLIFQLFAGGEGYFLYWVLVIPMIWIAMEIAAFFAPEYSMSNGIITAQIVIFEIAGSMALIHHLALP